AEELLLEGEPDRPDDGEDDEEGEVDADDDEDDPSESPAFLADVVIEDDATADERPKVMGMADGVSGVLVAPACRLGRGKSRVSE
ncbi:hypothetical protein BGZ98_008591, partial [Dissophora globulifera]